MPSAQEVRSAQATHGAVVGGGTCPAADPDRPGRRACPCADPCPRKTPEHGATYQIVEDEAAIVVELFRRYTDEGVSIADLTRWLTDSGTPTRATPRAVKAVDRPRTEWIQIPVPAIISRETFQRAAQRLDDNKRFAARNSKVPSLLQGLVACAGCGYGHDRTSTRTTNKTLYYYRCLGFDDYRYAGGRVCFNRPVRADYLDTLVWDHITGLLADPSLSEPRSTSGWNGPARPIRPPASAPAWSSPWPRPPPRSPA
jgi:hypothetical protein